MVPGRGVFFVLVFLLVGLLFGRADAQTVTFMLADITGGVNYTIISTDVVNSGRLQAINIYPSAPVDLNSVSFASFSLGAVSTVSCDPSGTMDLASGQNTAEAFVYRTSTSTRCNFNISNNADGIRTATFTAKKTPSQAFFFFSPYPSCI